MCQVQAMNNSCWKLTINEINAIRRTSMRKVEFNRPTQHSGIFVLLRNASKYCRIESCQTPTVRIHMKSFLCVDGPYLEWTCTMSTSIFSGDCHIVHIRRKGSDWMSEWVCAASIHQLNVPSKRDPIARPSANRKVSPKRTYEGELDTNQQIMPTFNSHITQ